MLNIIAKNLNLKIPIVQLTLNKDTGKNFYLLKIHKEHKIYKLYNDYIRIINYFIDNDINMHIFACDTSDKSECVSEMTNSFRTLPIKYIKDINNKELTTRNDGADKNVTIALQNKSTSNIILP